MNEKQVDVAVVVVVDFFFPVTTDSQQYSTTSTMNDTINNSTAVTLAYVSASKQKSD